NRGNHQSKVEKYREARSKRRALEKAKKLEILKNQPPEEENPLKNEFKEVNYNIPPENPINAKVGNHQSLPFDDLINQDNFDEVLDLTSAFQELTTTNFIKVNDKVIREHSVKATETTKPFSQSQHLPSLATKNLKFNKGASKEEFQERLENGQ
ncbi:putative helicase, partial [Candida maltosa Xu316]